MPNISQIQGTVGLPVTADVSGKITFLGSGVTITDSPSTNSLLFTAAGGGGSTFLTFIEDYGSAAPLNGFLNLYGSAFQGLVTTGSDNTVTFFNLDWTTAQKGVGIWSTNADTTTGTTTTAAVTPAGLSAKLGDQTLFAGAFGTGSTTALTWLGPLGNGQLFIGKAGDYPSIANLTAGANISIANAPGQITISASGGSGSVLFFADYGTAFPSGGVLNLYGSATQGLITTASGETITFFVLDWTTTQKGVGMLSSDSDTTTGTSETAAVTPGGLRAKLGDQTKFFIAAGTGPTTPLTWLGPLASGQLLVGSTGNYPQPENLGGEGGIIINDLPGAIVIGLNLTFSEDSGFAEVTNGTLNLFGSALQGLGTTGSGETVTFFNLDWTTTQKGVGILSTGPDTTTGTTTTAAVTPASLRAKLGDQTKYELPVGAGSSVALTWLGPLTNGQLLIGSTGGWPVPATLVGANGISISNSAGGIVISGSGSAITFIEDSGSATSASGFLYLWLGVPRPGDDG